MGTCLHALVYRPRRFQFSACSLEACWLACVLATVTTGHGLASCMFFGRVCVPSPFLFNMLFSATLHIVVVRFSEADCLGQNQVHLDNDGAGRVEEPSPRVLMAVRGIIFAHEAGIFSKSVEASDKMITNIGSNQQASRVRKRDEHHTAATTSRASPFVIEAEDQRCKQTFEASSIRWLRCP